MLPLSAAGCLFKPFPDGWAVPPGMERACPGDDVAAPVRLEDRTGEAEAADGLFVGVALSGGGTRAAVYAAEVLLALEAGGTMRRVDFVSANSGGAWAALWWGLSRDPDEARDGDLVWRADDVRRAMARDMGVRCTLHGLHPWHAFRSWAGGYGTGRQFADVIAASWYGDRRVGDLNPRRPKLVTGGTRVSDGSRFPLSRANLARLGLVPARVRIADIAHATSAVVGLFTPAVFPRWEAGPPSPDRPAAKPDAYEHVIDGGARDNLGVEGLLDAYLAARDRYPKGAVIVLADADAPAVLPHGESRRADLRGPGVDQVVDLTGVEAGVRIMFQSERTRTLGSLHGPAAKAAGIRVIHLCLAEGLPEEVRAPADPPGGYHAVLGLGTSYPSVADRAAGDRWIAPVALSIRDRHAAAVREAARRVLASAADRFRAEGLPVPEGKGENGGG